MSLSWQEALLVAREHRSFHLIGENERWECHMFSSTGQGYWISAFDRQTGRWFVHPKRTNGQGARPFFSHKAGDPSTLTWRADEGAYYATHPHHAHTSPAEPHIYFIQAGSGLVKIGTTTDVRTRIAALRTASPVPLKVLATMPGGRTKERQLHRRFQASRSHGEWFKPTAELMDLIARVRRRKAA